MKLSLVIPTYNERDNIITLLSDIRSEFKKSHINGEIIVVDDNSQDGTREAVLKYKKKNSNVKIISRKGKLGLSSAVLEGWKIARGEVLGVMDADLSHPPEKLSEMFDLIKSGECDFVIGSRYTKGGKIKGWGIYRKILSKGATILARSFTKVKDPMTGFFLIKKKCIKNKRINPKGFKLLLEIIIKADYKNAREVPFTFINRKKGKSKASSREIIYYLQNLLGYAFDNKRFKKEFLKFATVGAIGTVMNLVVLYFLTEFANVYYLLSAVFAFIVALTSNFIINKIWTFKENISENIFRKYSQFFSVSFVAFLFNIAILYALTQGLGFYYMISQIIAIGLALMINFLGNKIWTFSK